ncbi:lytic transglycosylase domain-containing protein [Streptantibioticus parmotrematis]|uniref:lytic transglycosylase domain-containing protein n=1 Tax=Streptantibioticus parmotrematis TaxID=2873249 RepID=UPI0033D14358
MTSRRRRTAAAVRDAVTGEAENMGERTGETARHGTGSRDGTTAPTPPLRPGAYDPADYAHEVLRGAREAGVSPELVMAVLHNEAYKPHHPLLERLWQWWKPHASFGVGNMHRATFEQVRRAHGLEGHWEDLRDDPAFAIRVVALHLSDLDRRLPERHTRRCTRDELLALGYNTGERNMRAFARGVPPGPMARSYLRRLRANRQSAVRAQAPAGD